MTVRRPTHAGSWYSDNRATLQAQLDQWLDLVPGELEGLGKLPVPGARVIIAPHAGYSYSGPCAAFAYKCLDLSKAKRIFLIGPSHHRHLTTIALPELTGYLTPLSSTPLPLDTKVLGELESHASSSAKRFTTMSPSVDEAEHSMELHLPYIHRLLQRLYPSQPTSAYPPLVPMMVGSTSAATERAFGSILGPYLADEENAFVISSDFCHWGSRFAYTYYTTHAADAPYKMPLTYPSLPVPSDELTAAKAAEEVEVVSSGRMLGEKDKSYYQAKDACAIHESISACDIACMSAIASGNTDVFLDALRRTGNTVCGRHPIGVVMAGMEGLQHDQAETTTTTTTEDGGVRKGKFYFLRYERSSDCFSLRDSSVSYVSAFAVL
ncbi:MEMO1 protein [Nannizzia gypsea CBS 118893]|uniref:MEMO1 protein n=1 Tax=Arthroderma gypseum (strain ATCC MYA-4604 / CBS 118893) TaxID=535722 RepID=E4V3A3_ARTGP|nr:MEMO1 protein [Nannizzia gypsea CBS 118893]EFR04477.1 MEMO1 protein [Nannizzia gypsea CBS 118893]